MWNLLEQVVSIIRKEGFSKIYVYSMGDFEDGLLRVKQLMQLRYGVVEGTVRYADFITNWLNELLFHFQVHEFQIQYHNAHHQTQGYQPDQMAQIQFAKAQNCSMSICKLVGLKILKRVL